jgi:hypothetical protein
MVIANGPLTRFAEGVWVDTVSDRIDRHPDTIATPVGKDANGRTVGLEFQDVGAVPFR